MIYDYHKASIGTVKQLATTRGLKIHTLSPDEDLRTGEIMRRMYNYLGVRGGSISTMLFSVFEYGKVIGDGMRVSKPVELLARPYYEGMKSCTAENIATNFHYISGPYVGSILYGYEGKTVSYLSRGYKLNYLYTREEEAPYFRGSSAVFFVTDEQGYPYLFMGRRYGSTMETKKTIQDLCTFADSMGCGLLLGTNHGFITTGSVFRDTIYTPRYVTRSNSKLGGFMRGVEWYDNLVPKSTRVKIGDNSRNTYRFQMKRGLQSGTRVLFKSKNPISCLSFDQQNQEFEQYQQTIKELVSA